MGDLDDLSPAYAAFDRPRLPIYPTPFIHGLQTAKGLVYLSAAGSEPVLSLGLPTGAATSASSSPAASGTNKSSDSDALPIVLAIIALVLAACFAAYRL
jgi:hypothetical protein